MSVILPCTWHGYHFGTLYGCPKYSLYLRLLNRWDSSGHGRCNRKNETLVYQKRNLDLLLLKCKVQNEKKPVYSQSFASYTNDLVWGEGVAVHGLLWGTIRRKLHFGKEGGRVEDYGLHDTISSARCFGQACHSPYPLSGGSFSLKENAQSQTFLKSYEF